jgi:hypothetical protein
LRGSRTMCSISLRMMAAVRFSDMLL